MSGMSLALFIHFLGLIALFGSFVLQQRLHPLICRGSSLGEIRAWVEMLRTTLPMQGSGAVMLLATGLYMASQGWGLKSPWVDAAMAGLVALAALNLPAQVRFLRAIGPLLSGEPGASPSHDLRARLADPTCRIAMWFANGLALGILWLMAAKPGAVGSGSVLVGAAALLGGIGLLIERKGAAKAVTEQ